MPRAALLVQLRNNLSFTELCIESIEQQSFRDFELIFLADNASSNVIKAVQTRCQSLSLPAHVAWSSEQRSAAPEQHLLHTALQVCSAEFLMFSDSTMLLHPLFAEQHVLGQQSGSIATGRQVELSSALSSRLNPDDIRSHWLQRKYAYVLLDGVFGQSTQVSRGISLSGSVWQRLLRRRSDDIYAANFSLRRDDAVKLRDFIDSALELNRDSLNRFADLRIQMYRNSIIQYHLHESHDIPLPLVPGVLERVKRLRYSVSELGLQPALMEAPGLFSRRRL